MRGFLGVPQILLYLVMAAIGHFYCHLTTSHIAMGIVITHLICTTIKSHLKTNLLEQRIETLEKNK